MVEASWSHTQLIQILADERREFLLDAKEPKARHLTPPIALPGFFHICALSQVSGPRWVVARLLVWLASVLAYDEKTIANIFAKIAEVDTGPSCGGTRDELCVASSKIRSWTAACGRAPKPPLRRQQKDKGQLVNNMKKLYVTLVQSCKTSVADLNQVHAGITTDGVRGAE